MIPDNMRNLYVTVYAVCCLASTMIFSFVIPPFQVPDETEHYLYARAIGNGAFLPRQLPGSQAGGDVEQADLDMIIAFGGIPFRPEAKVSRAMFHNARAASNGQTVAANYWGAAIYPPLAYAVPAATLAAADLLGADRLTAFYLGRLSNAVLYTAATAAAILVVPAAWPVLAFLFLMPMTLSQAGSFSADAFVFSLTALICALFVRMFLEPRRWVTPAWLVVQTAAIAAVSLVKLPMLALVLPLLAAGLRRRTLLTIGLVAALFLVVAFWIDWFVLTEATKVRGSGLGNVSSDLQLQTLIADPLRVVSIAANTLDTFGEFYWKGFFAIFGWLDAYMPLWYYVLSTAVLSLLLVGSLLVPFAIGIPGRVALIACATGAAAATFGALYLSWTEVGLGRVVGVQGRYFIPIAVPFALGLAGALGRRPWRAVEPLAGTLVLTFWLVSVTESVRILIGRYYLVP